MAVAFDAAGSTTANGSGTSPFTYTHTPVGTPTAVGVWVWVFNGVNSISSVSYGGTSMTQSLAQVNPSGTECNIYIYGLASPASGAKTVSIATAANSPFMVAMSITVTGSDTTTCFRNVGFAAGNGTGENVSLATVSGDLQASLNYNTSTTATPGAGQTTAVTLPGIGNASSIGSYQSASSTSTNSSYTWTGGSTDDAVFAGAFKAAAGDTFSGGTTLIMMRDKISVGWRKARGLLVPDRKLVIPSYVF